MKNLFVVCCVLLMAIAGCSSGVSSVKVEPVATSSETTARAVLEQVAETGELGSGLEELRMAIDEMQSSDPSKASALKSELESLESSSSESAAKSKAKQMLEKL